MSGKLRRSISFKNRLYSPYLLINGKPVQAETLDVALRTIEDHPIVGPLAVWYVRPDQVCIGEVGAWAQNPIAYGRWDEMFPLFSTYARML